MKLSMGTYAYCIVELEKDADITAALPKDTFLIQCRDVGAIVSNVPKSSWQPTRKNILRHQKIVAQLQEGFELLPLRFGTVFKSSKEVMEVLDNNYHETQKLLYKIRGRAELGLRVFWNHESFLREVGNKKVEKLKKEYESVKKDRYLIALEAGKIIEAAVLRRREEYVRLIFEPLTAHADDSVLNPVTGEKMVFNAAFLIKKNKLPDFDKMVETFCEKYKDKFTFRYSGPWPPYNFAKVNW